MRSSVAFCFSIGFILSGVADAGGPLCPAFLVSLSIGLSLSGIAGACGPQSCLLCQLRHWATWCQLEWYRSLRGITGRKHHGSTHFVLQLHEITLGPGGPWACPLALVAGSLPHPPAMALRALSRPLWAGRLGWTQWQIIITLRGRRPASSQWVSTQAVSVCGLFSIVEFS